MQNSNLLLSSHDVWTDSQLAKI